MVKSLLAAALVAAVSFSTAFAGDIKSSVSEKDLSRHRHTPLGLYLSPNRREYGASG